MLPEKGNHPATVILIEKCITLVETLRSKLSWYYYVVNSKSWQIVSAQNHSLYYNIQSQCRIIEFKVNTSITMSTTTVEWYPLAHHI